MRILLNISCCCEPNSTWRVLQYIVLSDVIKSLRKMSVSKKQSKNWTDQKDKKGDIWGIFAHLTSSQNFISTDLPSLRTQSSIRVLMPLPHTALGLSWHVLQSEEKHNIFTFIFLAVNVYKTGNLNASEYLIKTCQAEIPTTQTISYNLVLVILFIKYKPSWGDKEEGGGRDGGSVRDKGRGIGWIKMFLQPVLYTDLSCKIMIMQ